jgi:hypothetical protein
VTRGRGPAQPPDRSERGPRRGRSHGGSRGDSATPSANASQWPSVVRITGADLRVRVGLRHRGSDGLNSTVRTPLSIESPWAERPPVCGGRQGVRAHDQPENSAGERVTRVPYMTVGEETVCHRVVLRGPRVRAADGPDPRLAAVQPFLLKRTTTRAVAWPGHHQIARSSSRPRLPPTGAGK